MNGLVWIAALVFLQSASSFRPGTDLSDVQPWPAREGDDAPAEPFGGGAR